MLAYEELLNRTITYSQCPRCYCTVNKSDELEWNDLEIINDVTLFSTDGYSYIDSTDSYTGIDEVDAFHMTGYAHSCGCACFWREDEKDEVIDYLESNKSLDTAETTVYICGKCTSNHMTISRARSCCSKV